MKINFMNLNSKEKTELNDLNQDDKIMQVIENLKSKKNIVNEINLYHKGKLLGIKGATLQDYNIQNNGILHYEEIVNESLNTNPNKSYIKEFLDYYFSLDIHNYTTEKLTYINISVPLEVNINLFEENIFDKYPEDYGVVDLILFNPEFNPKIQEDIIAYILVNKGFIYNAEKNIVGF